VYAMGKPKELTATGSIASGPAVIYGFTLTPAAAVATAVIREGGGAGTVVMTLQAAANGGSVVVTLCMNIQDPHVTLAGAGALFTAVL
jgi:hypothetical protein